MFDVQKLVESNQDSQLMKLTFSPFGYTAIIFGLSVSFEN